MVLTMSSQYPRLGVCRAFDASMISDYPEEQEWLIGFIYTRIRMVHTKEKFVLDKLPVASNLRFVFFALHLFRQQMFSMIPDMYDILVDIFLAPKSRKKEQDAGADAAQRERIIRVLQSKFEDFRLKPNEKQIVKLNDISPGLRERFLDKKEITYEAQDGDAESKQACEVKDDDDFDHEGRRDFTMSLDKIKRVFPNFEEVHFYNWYQCDDEALQSIIDFVKQDAQKQLKQIKFLYYDYVGDSILNNTSYFYDPKQWNE